MKKLVLFSLVLALTGTVSAAEYNTILFDDDLDQHFYIEGWISSQSQEEIDVALKYNLTLTHEHFNSTEISSFEAALADSGEELASDQTGSIELESGESKIGFLEIQSKRLPNRVNQIIFRTNHTGISTNGDKRPSYAENDIDYSITSEYPEILSLKTNQSEVERGQNITVIAHTDDIEHLEIEGNNLTQAENNIFRGKVKVPEEASIDGISYKLQTGSGNEFTETVNVSVVNPAPKLNTSYDQSVEGDEVDIELKAADDIKINQTYVVFQGQQYNTTGENRVTLSVESLQDGKYNFTAVAIDNEGAETRENGSFEVIDTVSGNEGSKQGNPQSGEDKASSERQDEESGEEPASFPGIIIDPIIEFIKNQI